MYKNIWAAIILSMIANLGSSQSDPLDIIQKSIQYHDPNGLLKSGKITMQLVEMRPNGSDRNTEVQLDEAKEYAKISTSSAADMKIMELKKGKAKFKLNGKRKISKEDKDKHRLTGERVTFMKNYYRYLWLLPITLEDPGTIIANDYNVVDFFGKTCIELKVTYEPSVGGDIWYVYFNPESYAMEGYRFYHDESANDGEYILLSDSVNFQSLRIPAERKWYTHKEDKHLGTDKLVAISIK